MGSASSSRPRGVRFYQNVVGVALSLTHTDDHSGDVPHKDAYWEGTGGFLGLSLYPLEANSEPSAAEVAPYVDDLSRVLEAAKIAGIRVLEPVRDTPWGRRATLEDPDGNRVVISQVCGAVLAGFSEPAASESRGATTVMPEFDVAPDAPSITTDAVDRALEDDA